VAKYATFLMNPCGQERKRGGASEGGRFTSRSRSLRREGRQGSRLATAKRKYFPWMRVTIQRILVALPSFPCASSSSLSFFGTRQGPFDRRRPIKPKPPPNRYTTGTPNLPPCFAYCSASAICAIFPFTRRLCAAKIPYRLNRSSFVG